MEFEPIIPVLKQVKIFQALDLVATVIGSTKIIECKIRYGTMILNENEDRCGK